MGPDIAHNAPLDRGRHPLCPLGSPEIFGATAILAAKAINQKSTDADPYRIFRDRRRIQRGLDLGPWARPGGHRFEEKAKRRPSSRPDFGA